MIREGTKVKWKWGENYATGEVDETHTETITRTIDGNEIKRKGTNDDPALVIVQKDGQTVLKLRSEVERADD